MSQIRRCQNLGSVPKSRFGAKISVPKSRFGAKISVAESRKRRKYLRLRPIDFKAIVIEFIEAIEVRLLLYGNSLDGSLWSSLLDLSLEYRNSLLDDNLWYWSSSSDFFLLVLDSSSDFFPSF